MYRAAVRVVVAKPNRFTDGMKCAIYKKEHTFDKYPVLLKMPYLKKHFIAYCLLMNRTQKQMKVAVNQITAKMDVVDTNDDDNNESVSDSSDSDTTNDTNQDFHQVED